MRVDSILIGVAQDSICVIFLTSMIVSSVKMEVDFDLLGGGLIQCMGPLSTSITCISAYSKG